ncbi:MAG: ribosomal-processing cysteine protease Prp, partial [Oscillospiraceae bacterium]|nr:ribosomal-processing cysteine protease Prp [Oscillospiraceae bacterium]
MLKAVFSRKNGRLCRCSVKGHAGYAEHGQDVV